MELNAFEVDLLDSKSCFSLAETQGEFLMDDFIDAVNVSNGNFASKDDGESENIATDKYKYSTAANIKGKISYKNSSASAANAEVVEKIARVEPIEQAWRPEETLVAYNTSLGSEAENVLLPEISHNEFNLCLNNILNYDDDILIPESLSPRVIIPTDDSAHTNNISSSPSSKSFRTTHDSAGNGNQRLTTRNEAQLQNIFDIIQLSEDMDLQRFRTDGQTQQQAFSIDNEWHIEPTSK